MAGGRGVGFVYGAGTQYLAARTSWGSHLSGLAAPWLALPFVAGWLHRRSAAAGLAVTVTALAAYFAMTLSPIEGVHLTAASADGLLRSNLRWELGGLVTGPLMGWLGGLWREAHWWPGPAVVGAALLAERLDGRSTLLAVGAAEATVGLLFAVLAVRSFRRGPAWRQRRFSPKGAARGGTSARGPGPGWTQPR